MRKVLFTRLALTLFCVLLINSCSIHEGYAAVVQLEWRIIKASHKEGAIDPRLKDIYRDLGTVFNYRSYQIVNMNRLQLSRNQSVSIPLSRDKTCVIRVTNVTPKWVNVQIQIRRGNRSTFGTAVRLMNGRTLLIGGPSNRNSALIFSLRSFW